MGAPKPAVFNNLVWQCYVFESSALLYAELGGGVGGSMVMVAFGEMQA